MSTLSHSPVARLVCTHIGVLIWLKARFHDDFPTQRDIVAALIVDNETLFGRPLPVGMFAVNPRLKRFGAAPFGR